MVAAVRIHYILYTWWQISWAVEAMPIRNNYTELNPWVLEIQAMKQIHCNLSLNAGVGKGGGGEGEEG